jgi:sugar fermentation stimulation protein A
MGTRIKNEECFRGGAPCGLLAEVAVHLAVGFLGADLERDPSNSNHLKHKRTHRSPLHSPLSVLLRQNHSPRPQTSKSPQSLMRARVFLFLLYQLLLMIHRISCYEMCIIQRRTLALSSLLRPLVSRREFSSSASRLFSVVQTFDPPLLKGMIYFRPNRFIMQVNVLAEESPTTESILTRHETIYEESALLSTTLTKCHCPVTGRLGALQWPKGKDSSLNESPAMVPCLLFPPVGPPSAILKRSTGYTVEAIEINGAWIGINQNKANRFVESLLEGELLDSVLGIEKSTSKKKIERERTLGSSKLDFLINGNHYIEVKSPMTSFTIPYEHPLKVELSANDRAGNIGERLIRHTKELTKALDELPGTKATLIVLFQYEAPAFTPSKTASLDSETSSKYKANWEAVRSAMKGARESGMRTVQVNVRIDEKGVTFLGAFKVSPTESGGDGDDGDDDDDDDDTV